MTYPELTLSSKKSQKPQKPPQQNVKDVLECKYSKALNVIYLQGSIGEEIDFVEFDILLSDLEQSGKDITIKLNSDGGCLFTAFAIAGRITTSPSTIIIEAYGSIASAAILMLAVGDIRRSSKFTAFMHHAASSCLNGNMSTMENTFKSLQLDEKRRYAGLAEYTLKGIDWWREKANPDYYFDAAEALEIGLIDEIF